MSKIKGDYAPYYPELYDERNRGKAPIFKQGGGSMAINNNFPEPTFLAVIDKDTSYGAVCRQGKYHVRHYPRKIKDGMSCYKVAVYCAYANIPIVFPKLFGEKGV